jgi:HlyD family secretion protein
METTAKETSLLEQPMSTDFAPLDGIEPRPARPSRRWLMWVLACVALAGAGVASWTRFAKPTANAYTVVTVRRGTLAMTISATRKVQAVTTVQVGTQVSGTVSELHADFNDHVKAGQVIARLDPSQIEAQLQQAKASLAAAQAAVETVRSNSRSETASVQASKANVDRAASVTLEADRAYKNTVALVEAGAAPARQVEIFDAARAQAAAQKAQADAQYGQAVAQAQASNSQLDQALAQATQSKASVDVAAVNVARTIIRAPIDGVVVSRNVDVGQTVAASLQAPTLFLIAQDLTKMQVLADVDEADVGQLNPDSKVSFTVDAFPTETFQGRISQIRLSPNVVQNVVTYTAVISVANPKLQLRPGMTATVTATVAEKRDVLVVPNAALRYRPETTAAVTPVAPAAQAGKKGGTRGNRTTLYKVEGAVLKPVSVRLGMTDGASTEVIGEELTEGDRIAAPQQPQGVSQQKQTQASPFSGSNSTRKGRF